MSVIMHSDLSVFTHITGVTVVIFICFHTSVEALL